MNISTKSSTEISIYWQITRDFLMEVGGRRVGNRKDEGYVRFPTSVGMEYIFFFIKKKTIITHLNFDEKIFKR